MGSSADGSGYAWDKSNPAPSLSPFESSNSTAAAAAAADPPCDCSFRLPCPQDGATEALRAHGRGTSGNGRFDICACRSLPVRTAVVVGSWRLGGDMFPPRREPG
ncbi:hypothetical protein S7711_10895 [Stachybotrys chartarum IBT 7711]|uniref:Uncharacterized protein n=1 Tax=Stachybotrys chartarum (strain CBS 109288 / IBT 7711) TaxID=1280523 RepID=A0A084ASF6_STACB|nr:hypothetical protein S7711_10895 [Stachybotrys chartarum IBT 7711]